MQTLEPRPVGIAALGAVICLPWVKGGEEESRGGGYGVQVGEMTLRVQPFRGEADERRGCRYSFGSSVSFSSRRSVSDPHGRAT